MNYIYDTADVGRVGRVGGNEKNKEARKAMESRGKIVRALGPCLIMIKILTLTLP